MSQSYLEILETFPVDSQGKADAWTAAQKFARMLTDAGAASRLSVGRRPMLNEVNQPVIAVLLVART